MVYGVFRGEYSDLSVDGYFENREDAEAYCERQNANRRYGWEECYIKPLVNLITNDPDIFRHYIYSTGDDCVWEVEEDLTETKRQTRITEFPNGIRWVNVWMLPCDSFEAKVRKIAQDELARDKAEKAGIV